MPRGTELIGLPVLAGPRLRRIGRVREVLLHADGTRICGLLLDAGGWFRPRVVLDYQAVRSVGEAHILADEGYLDEPGETRCCRELLGLPVLTATGEEVGIMDDFHFSSGSGEVTALQLSRGFVEDLLRGKDVVSLEGPLVAGEAAILLDGPDAMGGIES